MDFVILNRFQGNEGVYGDVYWCSYIGDHKIYMCKKLKSAELSLSIELEAARRLAHLPTVFKVKGMEHANGADWLVSEYVPGQLLADYYGDLNVNLCIHLLCTLEEFAAVGVCHNDLHAGNIIVSPSEMTYVEYKIKGKPFRVHVFGFIPVVIDFGLSRIEGFKYKPVISGLSRGNMSSLINDPRFDAAQLMSTFTYIFTEPSLRKLCLNTAYVKMDMVARHIKDSVRLIWKPIEYNLENKFDAIMRMMDYNISGILLSFPDMTTSERKHPNRHKDLERLNRTIAPSVLAFTEMLIRSLKTGPSDPSFSAFCVLSDYLKKGVDDFVEEAMENMPQIMYAGDWLDYLAEKYDENIS